MKKIVLFFTFALLLSTTIFAQVPANDLIQNATTINKAPFNDFNVRLDLATANFLNPVGCNIGGWAKVYYKFTAETTGPLIIELTDSSNLDIGQIFAIVFTAPSLNVVDETELSLFSSCAFEVSTNLNVTQGDNYYILVYRNGGGSNFSNIKITIPLEVPISERNVLVGFYNATNGANWTNSTNWNTTNPVSTWFGLTVEKISGINHVTGISFNDNNVAPAIPTSIDNLTELKEFLVVNTVRLFGSSNSIPVEIGNLSKLQVFWIEHWNLQGAIPSTFGNLNALTTLVIRNTNMSGAIPNTLTSSPILDAFSLNDNGFSGTIPDFTSSSLNFFRIQNNNFQFGDFENEFASYQSNISFFWYSPQKKTSADQSQLVSVGDNITIDFNVSGNNNVYQWYFNNVVMTGEVSNTLMLNNIQTSQFGTYRCDITNTVVTGLTLQTGDFILEQNPTTHPDYPALLALYNATNGANWTDNTNWLDVNQPISTWYGLTVVNNRVEEINLAINNLSGNIPPEIGDITNLKKLILSSNTITGAIPIELGNLSNLEFLNLNFNNLTGIIPSGLATLTSLEYLFLSNNDLSGVIPDFTSTLSIIFWIQSNNFQFADFENEFASYQTNISNFTYSPQKPNTVNPNNFLINIGDNITLNSAPISGAANQYQWYLNAVAVTGETSPSLDLSNIQSSQFGTYQCIVTSTLVSGLSILAGTFEVSQSTLSITDNSLDNLVVLYPNPTKDVLNIKLSKSLNTVTTNVYDVTGKLIFSKNINSTESQIDISQLQTGLYFIRIETENASTTKRFIKQ